MDGEINVKTLWSKDPRKREWYYYISFLVWPFGVMLAAIKHWDRSFSRNVFWLFCIYAGLTFIISEGEFGADSSYYSNMLKQFANSEMGLSALWDSFYSDSSGYVDIVQPLITFLISRLTSNPVILFTAFGLIFGYFYSRNIWYVLGKLEGVITPVLFIYILTFALLNPIWNINGFRMWTAAQIFLYGALPYLLEGKTKSLIWSAASILVHFSFLYPVAGLIIFFFLRNRLNFYLGFFIVTSFIKELDLEFVRNSLSFLPGFLQARVTGYTNQEYADFRFDRTQLHNWYIVYSKMALQWIVYAMTIFIYAFLKKNLIKREGLLTLFCYSLFIYGFANIFSLVPSGERMLIVANTFMYAFIVIFISVYSRIRNLSILKTILIPLLLLFCIVKLREGLDFFGLTTFIGNPIFAAFYSDTVPVIEKIKEFL